MKDTSIDNAIKKALASHKDQNPGPCPDRNILASYLEMSLSEAEKHSVERHASCCPSCQQTIGLALRLTGPEADLLTGGEPSSTKKVLFHISLPVSMVAVILLALLAGALFYRVLRESSLSSNTQQTAQLQPPAKALGISAPKSPVVEPGKRESAPREQPAVRRMSETRKPVTERHQRVILPVPGTKDSAMAEARTADEIRPLAGVKTELAANGISGRELPPPPAPSVPPSLPAVPVPEGPPAEQLVQTKSGEPALDTKTMNAAVEYKPVGEGAQREVAFGKAKLASARSQSAMIRQVDSISGPREAVGNLARRLGAGSEKSAGKKLGGRAFYFDSGYWIDSQCAQQPTATYVEIKSEAAEYSQILKVLPGVEKMRPAIVYWENKNYIIR